MLYTGSERYRYQLTTGAVHKRKGRCVCMSTDSVETGPGTRWLRADQGNSAENSLMAEGIAQLNKARSISAMRRPEGMVLCTFITPSISRDMF